MKQHSLTKFAVALAAVLMSTVFITSCGGGGDGGGPAAPAPTPVGTAARLVTMTVSMPTVTGVLNSPGTATGKLAVNMDTGAIGGAILYSGLSTSTTRGSIRRTSDNIEIVPLSNPTGTTTGAWSIPAGTVLDQFQLIDLVAGGFHFRVDTVNTQITGEKRGDIVFPSITITTPMPPVAGTGSTGGGTGTLTANLGTGVISGSITFSGLTSAATAAHIHLRSDNSVIVTLEGGAGAAAGTFTIPAGTFLNAPQLKALTNDGLYFAVHSQNFQPPVSELLGNIVYPITTIPTVPLGGNQEVPPVTTVGNGTGSLTVNLGTGKISGSVAFSTPSIASAAHIHQGFAGVNGPPIITLTGGETLTSGTWNVPADRLLNVNELGALIGDGTYVNVHTAQNPNGEIRGQIVNVPTN